MVRRFSKKKGPVRSKKVLYDGITFQSGLEKYMYIALKIAKIKAEYEGTTYELIPSFNYDKSSYERQANGKGEYKDRGKKKYLILNTLLTLLDPTSLSNVREERTKLFRYVGSYLKCIYTTLGQKLRYINHKIKRNATKP